MFLDLSVFADLKQTLVQNIHLLLPEPHGSLLAGIVLGEKSTLPRALHDALVTTGTIHVVVVSGYNISVVIGWVAALNRYLGKRLTFLLIVVSVVSYTLLSGAEAPTIRSAIMGLLVWGSKVVGRVGDSLYLLLLTAVLMYVFDHSVITSISFQLSFLATLGILLFSTRMQTWCTFLPHPFSEDLATTLSAQLLVFPVLLYYFGSISLIAPLVNVLILWTIPLATIGGFVTVVLSLISLSLAHVAAWVTWVPLMLFYQTVRLTAQIPFSQLLFPPYNIWLLVGLYCVVGGGALFVHTWGRLHEAHDAQTSE